MKRALLAAAAVTVLTACRGPVVYTVPVDAAPAPAPATAADFPTTPPALGPTPVVTPPVPVGRTLSNGMRVLYVRQAELPVVAAEFLTGGGSADDPAATAGLAAFTAAMLDEGAGGMTALELSDALDMLGARLSTGAGVDGASADLYVLRSNLPAALRLLADVVMRPGFPADEVARLREQRLTDLARAKDVPSSIAENAFQTLVFGATHPYGRVATTTSVGDIDRAKLQRFHSTFYRPERSTLILAGDVSPADLHPVVEEIFGNWSAPAAAPPIAALPAPRPISGTTVYLIDKPGAAQSEIRIGHPGVSRDTPDYFPLMVLNTLLGGSFTSRLNQNLRETHGYTYGAGSRFTMNRGPGPFTASSAVVTEKTDSALIEFFSELNRIRDEAVPQDELERAKRYVALGLPQNFETTSGVASQIAGLVRYGIDPAILGGYVERIMAVSAEDVSRVAREYVRPGRAVVVVVGDRSTIEAGLRDTGIAPVEIRDLGEFVR